MSKAAKEVREARAVTSYGVVACGVVGDKIVHSARLFVGGPVTRTVLDLPPDVKPDGIVSCGWNGPSVACSDGRVFFHQGGRWHLVANLCDEPAPVRREPRPFIDA